MHVTVTNAQRALPINTAEVKRLARRAIRTLRIRTPGTLAITFISDRRIRTLNNRFLRHDRTTDVLCFRYDPQMGNGNHAIVGEILIAPGQARAYAKRHGLSYTEELSRYVVHGLLHWRGYADRTKTQQRQMRAQEDRLLARCRR